MLCKAVNVDLAVEFNRMYILKHSIHSNHNVV